MLNPQLFTQHKAVPQLAQIPGNSAVHLGTFQPLDKPSFNHQLQQWRCRTGGKSSWARGINWASPSLLRSCTSRWAQPQVMSEEARTCQFIWLFSSLGRTCPICQICHRAETSTRGLLCVPAWVHLWPCIAMLVLELETINQTRKLNNPRLFPFTKGQCPTIWSTKLEVWLHPHHLQCNPKRSSHDYTSAV